MTYDSGLFVDSDNNAVPIWFFTSRVAWPTGITFAIWNDALNMTDFGPTFGFTLSFDLMVASKYL